MSKINFNTITNSQKWKFLRSNTKICSFCNKEKKLVSFFVKETNSISNMCKICYNRNKKNQLNNQIFEILQDSEIKTLLNIL